YMIDRFGAIAVASGGAVSFRPNFRITDQAFPPVIGVDPVINPTYMGDYDQMTADNYYFYTVWGDNRDNSTGHTGKNANVRFAKFRVTGATAFLPDRKSTRLNSSHVEISYAVFCLKKKKMSKQVSEDLQTEYIQIKQEQNIL